MQFGERNRYNFYIESGKWDVKSGENRKRVVKLKCKVILNLNPADPCVDMQTTMFLKYKNIDMKNLLFEIDNKIKFKVSLMKERTAQVLNSIYITIVESSEKRLRH